MIILDTFYSFGQHTLLCCEARPVVIGGNAALKPVWQDHYPLSLQLNW
jgi:hypothetical protein